jgi:hypothetical protein
MTHMTMAVLQDDERHSGGTAGELLHDPRDVRPRGTPATGPLC